MHTRAFGTTHVSGNSLCSSDVTQRYTRFYDAYMNRFLDKRKHSHTGR